MVIDAPRRYAATDPHRVAVVADQTPVTWADLDALVRAWHAVLDVPDSGRIATITRNSVGHLAVYYACVRAGVTLTPLSFRATASELAYQIDHAAPAAVLYAPDSADLATASLRRATHRPAITAVLDPIAAPNPERRCPGDPEFRPDEPRLLIYTSGSTRDPKGVVITDRNIAATNAALDAVVRMRADDVVLQVLPQHHLAGWTVQPLLALQRRARLVLSADATPGTVLALIQRHRVTTMMAVPTIYQAIADHPRFPTADLSSLRLAISGGAALPATTFGIWRSRKVPLCQGYGLTEAGPNVLCVPPDQVADSAGWAGVPYPGVDVRLRGADGGWITGAGRGELWVAGASVSPGYWRDSNASHAVYEGRWLRTGDIAERDTRGWYRIADRLTDIYISGGEIVSPAEVTTVLRTHPAVLDAAVIGVPDPRWGEVGVAAVVTRRAVTSEELRTHCATRLARFKVPARVVFVDALPHTSTGKLRRTAVRRIVLEGIDAPDP